MKINFKSMEKTYDKVNVIEYNPNEEIRLDYIVEQNKYIFPMVKIDESNIAYIGYIKQTNRLFIQYKYWRTDVTGSIVISYEPEPIGYYYENVPYNIYINLINSKNKVKYIENHIMKKYVFFRDFVWNC